jgi:hypothetical protein
MEQSANDPKQSKKPPGKKGEKLRRNETDWTNYKSGQEDDDWARGQDEPGDSFDNPQDWPQEGAGDDQGGGAW